MIKTLSNINHRNHLKNRLKKLRKEEYNLQNNRKIKVISKEENNS
jgi:hypothetical protein